MALVQTALVQCAAADVRRPTQTLPVAVSTSVAVPGLASEHHVRVRVLAVAINPTDWKMLLHFPAPANLVGCDFCGEVVETGAQAAVDMGTRVCGAVFPYSYEQQHVSELSESDASLPLHPFSGAFAEYVNADARLLLRVPEHWDDLQGACLGGVGWGTAGLALSDPGALNLEGFPSAPVTHGDPVVVYGGGTATGTMACQLLMRSGYAAIATASPRSAALATARGACATTPYASDTCAESLRTLAGVPIRHALDCITSADSVATCFAALARTGGRYACLEACSPAWRTRRAVRVKEVMGYEALGRRIRFDSSTESPSTYSRDANPALFAICARWATEVQRLLDADMLKHHPIREFGGRWDGIIQGLLAVQRGEVRGEKAVIRVASR